jgi:hypothetical protein
MRGAVYAVNTRSSWRNALMSSPAKLIFSFGMSRGPSPTVGRPLGLAGPAVGPTAEVIGASEVPLIKAPIPGTAFAESAGLGGVLMGPSGLRGAPGSCFTR